MTYPRDPRARRSASADRDRALSRVAKTTVAGGTGAVIATAALAVWLSQPANAKPGSTATKSGTSSTGGSGTTTRRLPDRDDDSRQVPDSNDGGLQLPDNPPVPDTGGGSQQQPPVSSGGS